jgi:predicted nucleic acid-binding protein
VGALTLPISGTVYVDTNSELSVLEVLVKPLRVQNASLQGLFLGTLYHTPGLSCIPMSRQILEAAAQVRATSGLKTPDAIHAATALIEGCTLFVTNDVAFRRIHGLNVALLSEIAAAP